MHVETTSFYVRVETGVSMHKVNTMVNTVNIRIAIRTLSETDDSVIALLLAGCDGVNAAS